MKNLFSILTSCFIVFALMACDKSSKPQNEGVSTGSGLKVAYVNADSILHNYKEFRTQSTTMEAKQKQAEDMLQAKGAALEKEFNTYQQRAQKGTMTGKEMQAQEKYLSNKQEALLAERDKLAKEIMDETEEINKRLQKVLQDKLQEIKKEKGYDFIFSYIQGGPILVADEKYDITAEVLKELNEENASGTPTGDTTSKK